MKFKLVESTINEAYSPSMPEALKAFIAKEGKYAVRRLINMGIDPNKAVFNEVPIPTSNRDPFFKLEGVTKIYDFGNGSVYVEGINDDASFLRSDGKWQPAKYLPAKEIMTSAKHIYIVDPNETKDELAKTAAERAANKKAINLNKRFTQKEIRDYGWYQYDPNTSRNRWGTYVDKSGYIVDPKRLEKKITELGIFKPEKKIAKLYDEILLARNNIAATFDEFSDTGKIDIDLIRSIKSAMSYLSDAAYYYNQVQDRLSDFEREKARYNGTVPAGRIRDYKRIIDSSIQESSRQVNNANDNIRQYLGTLVDWDTDEDDI